MKKQVKELTINEISINKSKFITYIFPVSSLEEIKEKLYQFKEEYKDATHICYSYILDENTFKYYDDGEPSSTAGAPIYQVLKGHNLIYSMCVVIRYFGGVKLGVGGLVRAYSNSCIEVLKKSIIIDYQKLDNYLIIVDYSHFSKLEYFLHTNNIEITNKEFKEKVSIYIKTNKKNLKLLKDSFSNIISVKEL